MTKVFVSHSSKDQPFVLQRLIPCLEQAGFAVWCSATHIRTAANWEREVRSALAGCDWFVVVLSPDAQRSEWVQAETHWAVEHLPGRVVPLMINSCAPSEIHLLLATIQFIDCRADHAAAMRQLLGLMQDDPDAGETGVLRRPADELLLRTALVARPRYAALSVRIVIADRPERERLLRILNRAFIGRLTDVDLRLSDPSVSRRHARIDVASVGQTPELTVTDLDSSNGTFVNGNLIHTVQGFRSGDIISCGDAHLQIEDIT